MIRETLEETRWDFQPVYISGIYQWTHANNDTFLRICFAGEISKEQKERLLDTGIERTVWLTKDEIRNSRTRSPLVLKCIEDYTSGHRYPLSLIQTIR